MLSLLLIFFLLMCFSAFFSSSETALFSLSRVQVHQFKERGGSSASKLISLLRTPRRTLVTILFGNELSNVCISVVGASIINRAFTLGVEAQTLLAVAILTPTVMIVCEIIPKNLALRYSKIMTPVIVFPIHAFYRLISPFREVLTWIAKQMVILFRGDVSRDETMIMEDEFRRLVDLSRKEGEIEEEEREIIHNVFEFSDKRVADIMTPSARMLMIPADLPFERLMEEIRSTQFSRVPVYEGDRSHIIGILHVRDLFSFNMRRKAGYVEEIKTLLKPVVMVDTHARLESLLGEFQKGRAHMAIVTGGGGEIKGLVTMDDLLEELFGEIEE